MFHLPKPIVRALLDYTEVDLMKNFTLSHRSGVPFYRQIVDHITNQIHAGNLKPGSKLPSVRQLSADGQIKIFDISTKFNTSDMLTKVLPHDKLMQLISYLHYRDFVNHMNSFAEFRS